MKKTIHSIEKALDLIELLSDNKKEMGITEIGKKLNMGLSTVYRMLTTLKNRGYISQNKKTLKYILGTKLFLLGSKVQNIQNFTKLLIPFLEKLSQHTKETVNYGILENRNVIFLNKIECSEALKADVKIGEKIPANCSAVGKSILAYLSEEEFQLLYSDINEKLPIPTYNSISTVEGLKECLKKVKRRGYSTDLEEFKIGINCIGVAILDKKGKAIAGISITGPSSRFNLTRMEKIKNTLINISKEVSKQLDEIIIL